MSKEYWLVERRVGSDISTVVYDITDWDVGEKEFVQEISKRMSVETQEELDGAWGNGVDYLKALEVRREKDIVWSSSQGTPMFGTCGMVYWVLIYL